MKKSFLVTTLLFSILSLEANAQNLQPDMPQMSAQYMMHNAMAMNMNTPLREAGNDAFGTIQEVIRHLNSNPNTDWKKVNLEALRLHLIDMRNMTFDVDVISQEKIPFGSKVTIKATTKSSNLTLQRVFKAHPRQLKLEAGWDMKVTRNGNQYILRTTTANKKDVDKIRGLGYIGLMAYGVHHQKHHWMMANGMKPHKQ